MPELNLGSATPEVIAKLEAHCVAAGLDWISLRDWGLKYGVTLFFPVVIDLILGKYAAALALAAAQGQQCLMDLLKALGVSVL